MKKKLIAMMLVASMVLGVTACGSAPAADADNGAATETTEAGTEETTEAGTEETAEAPAAASGEKILSVQIGPDPETIDPALNSAVDGGNMILHTHECLLIVDQEGKLAPGQAESWDVSDDGLTWTFTLREGL